ncbi:MAG TPA: ComF family protein [Coleofasciculaceae cyanobacterium]
MHWIGKLRNLLDVVLQDECPLCQRPVAQALCNDCKRQLHRCQLNHPSEFWQPPLPVLAWGDYGGALKRSLAALKYQNQPQLGHLLGDELAQTWLAASPTLGSAASASRVRLNPIVVPIPLHASKQKQRGYNQAELIANAFCHRTGLRLQANGLARTRATEAQFGLSPAARSQNLADAFQLGKDFLKQRPHQPVLLLDDIYTTGTTVRSAAQTLRRHQIAVIGVAAVAKAGE